jgi:hypothetical protein
MNCPQDIIEAHYQGRPDGIRASYVPGLLVGTVMYHSKMHHKKSDFKLFTFSWRLGHGARNLGNPNRTA